MGTLLLSIAVFAVQSPQPSLRRATTVWAVAAIADNVSTYVGVRQGRVAEGNPMLAWAEERPTGMLAAATAMDVAGVLVWNRYVGRRHPRVARIGLYATAAVRTYFAIKAIRMRGRLTGERTSTR